MLECVLATHVTLHDTNPAYDRQSLSHACKVWCIDAVMHGPVRGIDTYAKFQKKKNYADTIFELFEFYVFFSYF